MFSCDSITSIVCVTGLSVNATCCLLFLMLVLYLLSYFKTEAYHYFHVDI